MPASPGEALDIGPLHLQLYGVCVLLGFFVWVLVTARLWQRGGGDGIEAAWACLLAAPVAFIGARLYHVITDYGVYSANPTGIFDVAQGGLSIFGAVAGGIFALVFYANVRGWPIATFLDCAIVGIPLAQAIGRWGNYFNQELFGRPTDLPWGLHVDEAFRPYGYATYEQFHPVFLYESVLDVGIFIALGLLWRPLHERFRPGCIVGAYLILYGVVRVLMELLRSDPSNMIGPFRLNLVVAVLVLLTGALILIVADRRRPQ
ncbi:MAG: prolipoprotein diacylglyceryl transferase, partial [Gaiellales bacterium]|nr:prolipoprotein diacylglyceryl transferase [Gaiellales bacterium]